MKFLWILLLLFTSCREEALEVKLHTQLKADKSADNEILSGASGIVRYNNYYYVIRDNSNHLYQFQGNDFQWVKSIRLFPGTLPSNQKDRKKLKPDLEAMLIVPANDILALDSLMLIPSGSKKNRVKGKLISLTKKGELADDARELDFSNLYSHLKNELHKVNIEGAIVFDKNLILLQRGNSKKSRNALVYLNLNCVLQQLDTIEANCLEKIVYPDIGGIGFIPYTFTDAIATTDGRILFLAAAEETEDAVLDGDVSGAAIGMLNAKGEVKWVSALSERIKFEGIVPTNESSSAGQVYFLISDADSDYTPSSVYKLTLPPTQI